MGGLLDGGGYTKEGRSLDNHERPSQRRHPDSEPGSVFPLRGIVLRLRLLATEPRRAHHNGSDELARSRRCRNRAGRSQLRSVLLEAVVLRRDKKMLEDLRRRKHAHVTSASPTLPFHRCGDPEPKRRCVPSYAHSQPPPLVAAASSSPWTTERRSAPGGRAALLPRAGFHGPEEHNRFREMELFMRTTPQPLPMLGGLSSQFLPRIKVELPEPPESPLRRLNTDCGGGAGGTFSNNCDDSPLDVRIHPRSPNGSSSNRCAAGSSSVGGGAAAVVDNGEVEEIVANVELADDSTSGDVLEGRSNCTPNAASASAGGARMPYVAAARAVAERQLVELQRLHAEEEHKLKVELLKKQHMVADLQRKYWRMKVKALAQKAATSSYHPSENKSVEEEDSDSPD
ncbi:hypothetical protein HPB50_015517 [Hyalomma asiaticum]|uniref:Uncharacterized protein n=1 Tax=Hyalomma asiaticum TaxID=266040 RepID=A0ACB7S781_HYAAI|nr:hypothetical protein HPB50_015517 [Hyalomma asiaticum]